MQQDNYLGESNQPRSLHRYTYAFNNPVNYTDPSGHTPGGGSGPMPNSYSNGSGGGSQGVNRVAVPHSAPNRSANGERPGSFSNPIPKEQSKGHRPFLCSVAQKVQAVVEAANEVAQITLEIVEPIQDFIDPYQDRIYNAVKDTAVIQAIQRDARERPLEGLLAPVLMNVVYDAASFALGHDLFTGEKLSHGEELFTAVAIAIPVVSIAVVKHGGRLLKGGKQVATHVDEFSDGVKFAARHGDKILGGAGRQLGRHVDTFTDSGHQIARRGQKMFRRGEELATQRRVAQRLDDYASRTDPTIQRRLDDFVTRNDGSNIPPPQKGLPGREVGLDEASEFSGIPKEYLEEARKVAIDTETVCGLRQCNQKMNELRFATWAKDTEAKVFHPITGEKLKISSNASIPFKTNEHGLVSVNLDIGSRKVNYGVIRRPDGSFELSEMDTIDIRKNNWG